MRILFITQWFQPENFLCGLPFAKELVKCGHEVEVLTGFPNYPGGRVYDGYRIRSLQREVLEDIPVIRVPLYPSHDKSAFRRIINYTSFAVSAATIGSAAVKKADVAYVYNPPATIGLPAWTIRLIRGIPYVYDVKDLWPDSLTASGMFENRFGYWLADKWCKFAYKCADKVVVCTAGFKKKLIERGVPEQKIDVIYAWCDDMLIRPVGQDKKLLRELGLADRFNIVFAGNIGLPQALGTVLDAAQLVAASCPQVQFVLVGDGIEKNSLKQKADSLNLKNVKFLPQRPISGIAPILSLADVLLVHLKDVPLFRITVPSKLMAYMAVGKPILNAVRGETAELTAKANAGLSCLPEDPKGIAETACRFYLMPKDELEAMGANGKAFYNQQLSLKVGTKRFESIFESIAKHRGKKPKGRTHQ